MQTPWWETGVLSLTQAVAELLPLSGAGHIALVRMLFGEGLPQTVLPTSVGTWLAVVVFFRRELGHDLRQAMLAFGDPSQFAKSPVGRELGAIAIATLTSTIVAFALASHVAGWGAEPVLVGVSLLVSAAALGLPLLLAHGDRDVPTPWGAVLVGAAQGASVLPGLSRTAVTIVSLMGLGVRTSRAFELCFLMGLAPGFAWALYEKDGAPVDVGAVALALACGFLGGLASLHALRGALRRRALPAFSIFLVPLGVASVAWAYVRP